MAGKEKMTMEGEGKLKPIKAAEKPLQSRCSTSRLVDLMRDMELQNSPLYLQSIRATLFGQFIDIPAVVQENYLF
ncbi:hypothetical protein QJS10_CPB04g01403 [Acorus calamus]|uniref:Uncharacterized protein n=1 Tax=Acorus calamus TaxID=4465 RepID=A0AAV9EYU0_ACOCL|nr:hypothetical protein QJS10_CPB04g01403 [Acorus calamus]